MATIIVTVIILGAVVAAFLWTRTGNRKVGGSCSKQGTGCAGCTDTSCPLSKAVGEKNKYDELATFRQRYDAVFFDLDGTLLNTAGDLTAAVNHVLEGEGIAPVKEHQVIPVLGKGVLNLLHTFLLDVFTEEDFKRCYDEFKVFYRDHAMIKTYAYEGMRPLMERLKEQGYKTAVVTNKNDDMAKMLVGDFFPGLSDFTLGRTDAMGGKPDPEMMLYAADQLEVEPERILYVGDSEVDRAFAAAAGTGCVLVSWGFRGREGLEALKGVNIVDTPREILEAVG